jgi:rRNA maturation endonuclease Nob1
MTSKESKIPLIVDTNAFIKCLDLNSLYEKYDLITTENVLSEIRDKKAKQKYESLAFGIKTRSPTKEALSFV